MSTIEIDGIGHPVTDHWYEQNIIPYPELASWTHDNLEVDRASLLKRSQDAAEMKPGKVYTKEDENRLQAVTRVINAHRATRIILATHSLKDFEFEGVDQLHGNKNDHPCGCSMHVVFDHHIAQTDKTPKIHHHKTLKSCDKHQHLEHDAKLHFSALYG